MSENNPYAPPNSSVEDVAPLQQPAPPLWNPNAAASWSLLLSPIFGSILHMNNWTAMGEPDKAAQSKRWAIASATFIAAFSFVSALLPASKAVDGLGRLAGLVLLISWYYLSGKQQSAIVLARYGKSYPRKGWLKPLSLAVLAFIGFVIVAFLLGAGIAMLSGAA